MRERDSNFTNPLPQKSYYNLKEHFIYGKQKGWKKVIEWIITILAWILLLSYVIYLAYGMLAVKYGWYLPEFTIYNKEMIYEIRKYFFVLFVAMLIVVVFLIFWKNYNLRRFGKLHRRKFRPPVENAEIAELFEMDVKDIENMQKRRVMVFETNIVPEHLGIGAGKKKKEAADSVTDAKIPKTPDDSEEAYGDAAAIMEAKYEY